MGGEGVMETRSSDIHRIANGARPGLGKTVFGESLPSVTQGITQGTRTSAGT